MMKFSDQTERQNELINQMRETVRDYTRTLIDMEDQADVILGFEKFLKDSIKTHAERDVIPLDEEKVAVSLGDSIEMEFAAILIGAGFQKGLNNPFDWKAAERDFKLKPWKHKKKGNH